MLISRLGFASQENYTSGFNRLAAIAVVFLVLPAFMSGQNKPRPDAWEPLRPLIGKWEGTGKGQPGNSKVEREYWLVLNDKFLHVQNRSVYDPQPKNPKGRSTKIGE